MSRAQALLGLPLALLLVAGCASADPAAERREVVATLTEAANSGDADAVRRHADGLLELIERQLADDEVDAEEAERLTALAQSVRAGADAVDEDLQRRLEAEAEAEAARKQLEEAQRRLEEERRKAEEAAKRAEEGKGEGDKDEEKKDEDKDDE